MKYVRVELLSVIVLNICLFFLLFLWNKVVGEKTRVMYASVSRTFLTAIPSWAVLHTYKIQHYQEKHSCGNSAKFLQIRKSIMHAHVFLWLCSYIYPQNMFLSWMFVLNKKLRRILVLQIYSLWLSWFMPNK